MGVTMLNENPFRSSANSLESLVDEMNEMLGYPITIEDANHRLLAYSSHDDQTDPARVATIMRRGVPEKIVNCLWKEGVMLKINQSDHPVHISGIQEIGLGSRTVMAISTKKEILGYIWIHGNGDRLSDDELELLKKASHVAKNQLLSLNSQKKQREKCRKEMFWQILTGALQSHEDIKKHFEYANVSVPSFVSVVVFQFEKDITSSIEREASYMIKTLEEVSGVFYVVDERKLILLCNIPTSEKAESLLSKFIGQFIAHMNARIKEGEVIGGFGNIYKRYCQIISSYQEALTVLQLKHQFPGKIKDICGYKQLGIYRYLNLIHEKNEADGYENVSLQKLLEYDQIQNTDLVDTLEAFLNNDCNVNEAAKEIHVHTNTMNYRLKRISEIGDINLRCMNEKLTLFLDIKSKKLKQE
ncbi:PucR family transcriptional regulator [Texcoconibacillus texcoconensis]|uniref:DNA-binding PucR family transcriptional regulator n=1 Tax=Texcoconibacillus texcoconensis TaxID=1095777 RepID=A0A840QMN3_9BACI|nr:helix-turn-helix domain-containing protein [Texcoconibacillus texcoconensis]MBB5172590.1 DNA-binding PucR family transcriptional regulator [Texcoconibacillus texcoconensis]